MDDPAPQSEPSRTVRGRRIVRSGTPDTPIERLVVRLTVRVLAVSLGFVLVVLLAWRLRALLLLLAVSVFIAVLINPIVGVLVRRGLNRLTATLTVYLILTVLAVGLGYVFLHPLYVSATHFARDLPSLLYQAQHHRGQVGRLVARFHLASYVSAHATQLESAITRLGRPALAVGRTVVGGIVSLVTIAFISFFVVLEAPKIFQAVLATLSEERSEVTRRVLKAMSRQVGGFMVGDLATSLIAGIVVFISLTATGVPFAGVLAIWVALVDFLPLVGGLLGGVPAVGVAFLHSVEAGVITVVVFLVYQQFENHVLNPLIISRTVRLNPLAVLLAVLIGAEVGGIVGSTFGAICGAIFAVPIAGSIQVGLAETRGHRLRVPEMTPLGD